ncbi:MAG: hypothetical protein J7K45_00815 [Thaumarchaeota archaeon]|nr:hypothetical protein [Nitrososphaerota archaeon]
MAMRKRKAVSPVLAVLLMIAVSVALAVVIFTWSQGFLSSTSGAIGTEQGAQNIAAQSQITIENVVPDTSAKNITLVIRNVGSVSVSIGSIQVIGLPSNSGFSGSGYVTISSSGVNTGGDVSAVDPSSASSYTLSKGSAVTVALNLNNLASGDFITVKATTTVGSFAQYSITVP